jgi:hypothetical protein
MREVESTSGMSSRLADDSISHGSLFEHFAQRSSLGLKPRVPLRTDTTISLAGVELIVNRTS